MFLCKRSFRHASILTVYKAFMCEYYSCAVLFDCIYIVGIAYYLGIHASPCN